ncbi:MAG: CHRD domain-containing protein [Novosphingobium sp.]|nr:CHRD domain-containing protein [Novosphingobium sp.]
MRTNVRGRLAATALIAAALAVGAPALAMKSRPSAPPPTPTETRPLGGIKLAATLTGAVEVPPGDPAGSGTFSARLNPGHDQLCYDLAVSNIATPTAAHIHRGGPGVSGPPVVMLQAPANGSVSACAAVTPAVADEILANPGGFYVNVHNAAFPGGALRGQLTR